MSQAERPRLRIVGEEVWRDHPAYPAVYAREWRDLCAFLRARFGPGPPDCEDVAQQAFFKLGFEDAGAWRGGRLAYAAAPLGKVIADLNRYGMRARVMPGAAGPKVTAGLRPDQASAFVAGLPRVLPVTVAREADGGLLIRAR